MNLYIIVPILVVLIVFIYINQYRILRSLILLLLQFDPFNYLDSLVSYVSKNDLSTTLIEYSWKISKIGLKEEYISTEYLTFKELLLDLYFETKQFPFTEISFRFGDFEITKEAYCFDSLQEFLKLFNGYNLKGKLMPTNIKIIYYC